MTLDYTDTKTGTKFQAKKSYHVIESGNTISIRARVSFKLQILHCWLTCNFLLKTCSICINSPGHRLAASTYFWQHKAERVARPFILHVQKSNNCSPLTPDVWLQRLEQSWEARLHLRSALPCYSLEGHCHDEVPWWTLPKPKSGHDMCHGVLQWAILQRAEGYLPIFLIAFILWLTLTSKYILATMVPSYS